MTRAAPILVLLCASCGGGQSLKVDTSDPAAVEKAVRSVMDGLDQEQEDLAMAMKRAVLTMKEIGPAAVPTLVEYLEHDNQRISTTASVALGEIGPEAIPALLEALESEKEGVPMMAARALGNMGPAAAPAVPALFEAYVETGPGGLLAMASVVSLGKIGEPAITYLADRLESDAERDEALEVLEAIGPPARSAVPALMDLLEAGGDDQERVLTVLASIEAPAPIVVPAIIDLVEAGASITWMAEPLASYGKEAAPAVPLLVQILGSDDEDARLSAARVLGAIGPPAKSALPVLEKLAADPDGGMVAAAAADAIAGITGTAKSAPSKKPSKGTTTVKMRKEIAWGYGCGGHCAFNFSGSSTVSIEIVDDETAVITDTGTFTRAESYPDGHVDDTTTWTVVWKAPYTKSGTTTTFKLALEESSCTVERTGEKAKKCGNVADGIVLACDREKVEVHDALPAQGEGTQALAWVCAAEGPPPHDGTALPWVFGFKDPLVTMEVGEPQPETFYLFDTPQ